MDNEELGILEGRGKRVEGRDMFKPRKQNVGKRGDYCLEL